MITPAITTITTQQMMAIIKQMTTRLMNDTRIVLSIEISYKFTNFLSNFSFKKNAYCGGLSLF